MLDKNSHQRNTENKGSDSLDIRKKTNSLKKRYGTNDPFDIAKYLGIKVIFEPLESISGYYNKQLRMKQIHINHDLSDHDQLFTCAHELGHALLHNNSINHFDPSGRGITTSDYEYEANLFAVALLVDEQRLNMPLRQMSNAALKSVIDYNL